jgi:deoxyribodipyrimidine photolyase
MAASSYTTSNLAVAWLRRDLRLGDHQSLHHATRAHERVIPLFVLDPLARRGRPGDTLRQGLRTGCAGA